MLLDKEKRKDFFTIQFSLLYFVSNKIKKTKIKKVHLGKPDLDMQELIEMRDYLFSHLKLFDEFIAKNPFALTEGQLEVIKKWSKDFIKGHFYILRHLKKYTIFLSDNSSKNSSIYGVVGLTTELEDLTQGQVSLVETVLLPFDDRVVYDGLVKLSPFYFGGGIKRDLNNRYQELKAKNGVIEKLPMTGKERKSKEDLLKFYLKNERNRACYYEDILKLTEKNKSLNTLYHQEMGKVWARQYGKKLRQTEIKKRYFAILKEVIIASADTKKELEEIIKEFVSRKEHDLVYYYQFKG